MGRNFLKMLVITRFLLILSYIVFCKVIPYVEWVILSLLIISMWKIQYDRIILKKQAITIKDIIRINYAVLGELIVWAFILINITYASDSGFMGGLSGLSGPLVSIVFFILGIILLIINAIWNVAYNVIKKHNR